MTELGLNGRRYSGYSRKDADDYFEQLIAMGVNETSVGRSMFSLPGWLRDIGRCGLRDCYVLDMVNAHVVIQSRRHPLSESLKKYVENREGYSEPSPGRQASPIRKPARKQNSFLSECYTVVVR